MNRRIQLVTATMSMALATGGLAACSSGSKTKPAATTTAAASASGSAGAQRRGAFADPKVAACLKAAGITLPTGTRRSGAFPSGSRPSFSRPSGGFPSGSRPSGGFPSGGGFGGNSAQSKEIQAALKACGITLPTGGGRFGGGAAPTATPTPSAS